MQYTGQKSIQIKEKFSNTIKLILQDRTQLQSKYN